MFSCLLLRLSLALETQTGGHAALGRHGQPLSLIFSASPSLGPSFSQVPVLGFLLTRCWRTLITHLTTAPPFFITEPGFIQDPAQSRTYRGSSSVGIISFPFGEVPGLGVPGLEVNQGPMSCQQNIRKNSFKDQKVISPNKKGYVRTNALSLLRLWCEDVVSSATVAIW